MRVIDADALEKDGWMMHRTVQVDKATMSYQTKKPTDFPAIEPEPCEDVPDTNVGKIECDYVVSAVAVEEMLKNLLPARGMWEIEGDEAKNAICETVHDALEGLWKLPSARQEIIHCRECKHYYFADNRIPQEQRYTCDLDRDRWQPDSFCSFAERREE